MCRLHERGPYAPLARLLPSTTPIKIERGRVVRDRCVAGFAGRFGTLRSISDEEYHGALGVVVA